MKKRTQAHNRFDPLAEETDSVCGVSHSRPSLGNTLRPDPRVSPEWQAFFVESQRLAALARVRRAAAKQTGNSTGEA